MSAPSLSFKDLVALKGKASLLFDNRKSAGFGGGNSRSIIKGRGLEFSDTRPYMYGDDSRFIDWRLTARKQTPYLKLFTEEKEQQVFIVCDLRGSMNFASRGQLKSHAAARLSALVGWSALLQHHLVGGAVLTNTKPYFFPMARTQDSFLRLLKRISLSLAPSFSESPSVYYPFPSRLKKHVLLFYLSDFYRMPPLKLEPARKLFIPIVDTLEETPPPKGSYMVSDGKSFLSFDGFDAKKYGHAVRLRQNTLLQHKIPFKIFHTPDDPLMFLRGVKV